MTLKNNMLDIFDYNFNSQAMKSFCSVVFCFLLSLSLMSQEYIDGSFSFQTVSNKKYSLYIPSDYNVSVESPLVLGFHPWNTSNWNAQIWRDTLANFAEVNNVILVCPDGGVDGQVNDPIDIAFTHALLDSVKLWYNIDNDKKYVTGFSWGGLTTYTFGLDNADEFAGFMPIGAAINGTNDVSNALSNATGKPFFIIHGSLDSPNSRFYPIRDALIDNGACVQDSLLSGVGHTVNFEGRNELLNIGFAWLQSKLCSTTNVENSIKTNCREEGIVYSRGNLVELNGADNYFLFDLSGKLFLEGTSQKELNLNNFHSGLYLLIINTGECVISKKIMVN